MGILDGYPTIRQYVHDDQWAAKFLADTLAKNGDLAQLCYPDLYITPDHEAWQMKPKGYMAGVESGLQFIIKKARKQNRTDLIGNLLRGYPAAAAFETRLACALVTTFGGDAVEPYPRIAQQSSASVEFAVDRENGPLYFEATVLYDDRSEAASTAYCIRENLKFPFRSISGNEGTQRFLRKCREKVMQRNLSGPLVLCVNQCCMLPDPEIARKILAALTTWANAEPHCPLVAAAYWFNDRHQVTVWGKGAVLSHGISQRTMGLVEAAAESL